MRSNVGDRSAHRCSLCAAAAGTGRVRGFTVIELMLAVLTVALLASIALPLYQSWRDKARSRMSGQAIAAMSVVINQYATDNGGSFPADLATVGLSAQLDPWGRAYQYYNIAQNNTGNARKDKNINPINTDYDLYSMGPDGVSKKQLDNKDSVDDVVRARNGKFIGMAADF